MKDYSRFFSQPWLVLASLTPVLMVLNEVSLLYSITSVVMIFWKALSEFYQIPKIPQKATSALAILFFAIVGISFKNPLNQEPALSLLVVLTGLKIMDYRNLRDHKFVCLLTFIMLALKSLYSLDIIWLIPTIFSFTLTWYSLMESRLSQKVSLLAFQMLAALPLTLAFFFFFPRFVVPWAASRQNSIQESGFSNELGGGQVTQLAQSHSPVFRVRFLHTLDEAANLSQIRLRDLYWSGNSLNRSAGLLWREQTVLPDVNKDADNSAHRVHYEVLLEPQESVYLFGLENFLSANLESQSLRPAGRHIFKTSVVNKSQVYLASSSLQPVDRESLSSLELKPYLQTEVPGLLTTKFVASTIKEFPTLEGRLKALEKLFSHSGFKYTLSPGRYDSVSGLEDFVFKRRLGFCEHFAGAYASLARALGIPAQVVVGYQGGEYNSLGNYWLIRQSDAHAWVRVYYKNQWVRIDPTSWVAPLRIELGARDYFNSQEQDLANPLKIIFWQRAASQLFLDRVLAFVDSLNYQYSSFILDFDKEGQREFLKEYGKFLVLLLAISFFAIIVVRVFIREKQGRIKPTRSQKALRRFELRLARLGFKRPDHQPPLTFLSQIASTNSALKSEAMDLAQLYKNEMYLPKAQASTLNKANFR